MEPALQRSDFYERFKNHRFHGLFLISANQKQGFSCNPREPPTISQYWNIYENRSVEAM